MRATRTATQVFRSARNSAIDDMRDPLEQVSGCDEIITLRAAL
ncbi:MAG: hypothetical protein ACT6RN_26335 [Agrobacterium sp.]|uniref:Uncharacterized protein n=1 Tax=Ciceribacter selenitireducens ATCC BAA-1503 TaxID=1336235 RepID=A0A380TMK8_9HYPH|nr:unnamed protein product [Ciceribacter naphthalenivorans]SUS16532.1 unnamed protein product [Ciceribacter selenitireducens ATCC BAA-1503]